MIRKIASLALVPALAMVIVTGCRRDALDTDIYVGLDNSIADGSYQDMMNVIAQQSATTGFNGMTSGASGDFRLTDECPTTTFSEAFGTFPNTMTIDFGESCTGYLGVERSGKIIATFTGPYSAEGTTITITTDNYYVNGNKVEGVKTVINEGLSLAGNPFFSVIVEDGLITLATGETISWNASRIREWIAGSATPEIEDDVYAISDGIDVDYAVEGINRNGTPFTAHISDPLIRALDCRWMKSGVIEVTPEGFETRIIDFGDGDCDNQATLTIGGYSTTIDLPY